jgi:multidrug efflux system membrane fusion protein
MTTLRTVLTVCTAATLAAACSARHTAETKAPRPVKTQAVSPAAVTGAVRYSAAIEAFEQVPLAFKSSGYVETILRRPGADGRVRVAQAGDLVTRGTVLARVREIEYREQVNSGRARTAESEAGLVKAKLDLDRAKTLFAADSLTKPELDAAQANFDSSRARLAAAQAEVELASTALHDTALIAPDSGILLERKIEVGSLVGSGTVGFVLGNIKAVKARFGIPDNMIQALTLGETIDLRVEAIAGTRFDGRVTAIAPVADSTSRVFDVEVTIPNGEGRLRPGMIGTVSVRPASASAAEAMSGRPTVPLTAIVKSTAGIGGYAAFTIERRGEEDVARLRPVALGDVVGNAVVIERGLTVGERVIVTGASLVVDGEPIRVIP